MKGLEFGKCNSKIERIDKKCRLCSKEADYEVKAWNLSFDGFIMIKTPLCEEHKKMWTRRKLLL